MYFDFFLNVKNSFYHMLFVVRFSEKPGKLFLFSHEQIWFIMVCDDVGKVTVTLTFLFLSFLIVRMSYTIVRVFYQVFSLYATVKNVYQVYQDEKCSTG